MFHPQILVLTDPTGRLQKSTQQPSTCQEKSKCWHCQGEHYRKDCPTAPKQSSPTKYKSTKEKQHNLIKSFCKKFQDRRQINEICTPASDSSKEFNNFISNFENIMLEDSKNSSAWLATPNTSVINEVFIDSFHALYNIQVYNLHTQALFLIQVHPLMQFHLSFTGPCSNRLNCYPPTEKLFLQMMTA